MLALTASLAVALGLRLLVEGTCPSQAAVQAQLAPLLPSAGVTLLSTGSPDATVPDITARVEPIEDLLRVEVRDAQGRLLSLRDQRRDALCPDLAAFAAVVIAAAIATQPSSAPPVLTVPPAPQPPAVRAPAPRLTVGMTASGLLALTSARAAAGASIDLLFAQPSDVFGVRLSLGAVGMRRVAAWTAEADYTRLHSGLWARYRLRPPPKLGSALAIDLSVGALAALVVVEGVGFAQNLRSQGFDLGSAGGLRLSRLFPVQKNFVTLSADLLAVGWLVPQALRLLNEPVLDASQPPALPAWDILLSLGFGWQRRVP